MLETFNPVFLIFLSYGIGAIGTSILKSTGKLAWYSNHNYISNKLTKTLGVLVFGWLIRKSFMGKFNQKLKFKGKLDEARLEQLKAEMTLAENSHLIGFIVLQMYVVFLSFWGIELWQLILYTIFNIIFNLYLVFLQQYNKRRIDKLLSLSQSIGG